MIDGMEISSVIVLSVPNVMNEQNTVFILFPPKLRQQHICFSFFIWTFSWIFKNLLISKNQNALKS